MIRLGLDLDGVLCNFNPRFGEALMAVTGRDLLPKPFTTPRTWAWMFDLGYRKSEVDRTWEFVKTAPLWWAGLDPLHGFDATRRFLTYLSVLVSRRQLHVTMITTRPGLTAHWQSVEWLERHGLERPQVVVAADAEGKGKAAALLDLHAIVDDFGPNLEAARRHQPGVMAVLYKQPYNASVQHLFATVDSLDDLRAVIDRWAGHGAEARERGLEPSFTGPDVQPAGS